ncbi:methyl-accepting chemotaxis protein [Persephonella sp.]
MFFFKPKHSKVEKNSEIPKNETESEFYQYAPDNVKSIYVSSIIKGKTFQPREKILIFKNNMQEILNFIERVNEDATETVKRITEIKKVQEDINESIKGGKDTAEESSKSTQSSNEAIDKLAESVDRLKNSLSNIDNVLSVILEITTQTNLLALNAAIEAARAGEYGKGFSVVAEEVRNLAEKTSKSANDIKEIISQVFHEMENTEEELKNAKKIVAESVKNSDNVKNIFLELGKKNSVISEIIQKQAISSQTQLEVLKNAFNHISNLGKGLDEVDNLQKTLDSLSTESINLQLNVWNKISEGKTDVRAELLRRVIDHAIWMENVIKAIEGEIDWIPTDHTGCKLGKWYYSAGREEISKYGSEAFEVFKNIEPAHAKLHSLGIEAIKAYRNDEKEKAYRLVEEMLDFSKIIINLIFELYKLVSRENIDH